MSIAEQLGEIDLSATSSEKVKASLQTDNYAVLLVQGLESNDADILNVSMISRFSHVQMKERRVVCFDFKFISLQRCLS